jgi:hypothetical protein
MAPKSESLLGATASTLGKKGADSFADDASARNATAFTEFIESVDVGVGKIDQGPHDSLLI